MVAVEQHLAGGAVGARIDALVFLHRHPRGDALAVALRRLEPHETGVVLAEGVVGLELHVNGFARRLSLQRALEALEQAAVAAVQVSGPGRRGELDALRVVHRHAQRDEPVPGYVRSRLTRSNTSAA